MAKKLKIPFNTSEDFVLIGIASSLEDYRLAYFLNKNLCLNLEKKIDFLFYNNKIKTDIAYSYYEYVDENDFLDYVLLENKKSKSTLINYWKIYDYFLIISGAISKKDFNMIKDIVSEIQNVQVVKVLFNSKEETINISQNLFDEVNNLMSGIELHRIEINS